jgi:mRNA interferase YafQ
MFTPEFSNQFRKSYKRMIKRGANPELLVKAISLICTVEPLPFNYKEHNLSGNYSEYKECHILSDWLLIYKKDAAKKIVYFTDTGTHSDLFK